MMSQQIVGGVQPTLPISGISPKLDSSLDRTLAHSALLMQCGVDALCRKFRFMNESLAMSPSANSFMTMHLRGACAQTVESTSYENSPGVGAPPPPWSV